MKIKELESEIIYGEVCSKANHYQAVPDKNGQRRIIKDDVIRRYEKSFQRQCRIYKDRNINTPFVFYCRIYYANLAHDLDNSLKTILDCLQYCKAITNDNLCMKIVAEKACDRRNPRIQFAIQPIQQQLQF